MRKPKLAFIKYSIITFICASAILISGCGGSTEMFTTFEHDVLTALSIRFENNAQYAKNFEDLGILSHDEYETIINIINQRKSEFSLKDNYSNLNSILRKVCDAVSHYKVFTCTELFSDEHVDTLHVRRDDNTDYPLICYDDDSNYGDHYYAYKKSTINGTKNEVLCSDFNYTDDKRSGRDDQNSPDLDNLHLSSFVLGNYYAFVHNQFNFDELKLKKDESNIIEVDDQQVIGINLFNADLAKELNNVGKAQVYVLKPDITQVNGCNTIDGLIANIQRITSAEDKSTIAGELNQYFTPAYENGTGKIIRLIDEDRTDYDMVATSKVNHETTINRPGYDLCINQTFGSQSGGDKNHDGVVEDMIGLRFTEFNADAVELFLNMVKDNDEYFLLKDANSNWIAYYMVYPIQCIDTIANNTNNNNLVDVKFKQSGLGINLKKGCYVKYRIKNAWPTTNNYEFDFRSYGEIPNDNYYFKLDAAANNNETSISPIVISGYEQGYEIKQVAPGENHKNKAPTTTCARLVLTDYLEGTFSPGFVPNENVVAFGRKIRFNMENSDQLWKDDTDDYVEWHTDNGEDSAPQKTLQYTTGREVAYYIDKEGNRLDVANGLEITDFASITDLFSDNTDKLKVKTVKPDHMDEGITQAYKADDSKSLNDLTVHDLDLEYVVDSEIVIANIFPSYKIDKLDYSIGTDDGKQRMCIVATRFGIFDNALFSDWINSTSQTASLEWWNSYLAQNSFQYDVSKERILDLMADNYAYELSQSGIVVLDLDTVAKIQKQYDKEESESRTSWLRTFFMILGWGLILYSTLMMLAWVIDANFDIGVKLLDKLTFGNWVAVKYEEDVPYRNTNDQTFLDQKKMYVRAAIMIGVGIFLINVNIFNVVLTLIDVFGRAAAKVEEVIQGFR